MITVLFMNHFNQNVLILNSDSSSFAYTRQWRLNFCIYSTVNLKPLGRDQFWSVYSTVIDTLLYCILLTQLVPFSSFCVVKNVWKIQCFPSKWILILSNCQKGSRLWQNLSKQFLFCCRFGCRNCWNGSSSSLFYHITV